jgi:hypothetical protein
VVVAGAAGITGSAPAGSFVRNPAFLAAAGGGALLALALVVARTRAVAAAARATDAEARVRRGAAAKGAARLNPLRSAARPRPPAEPPSAASAFRSYADEARGQEAAHLRGGPRSHGANRAQASK